MKQFELKMKSDWIGLKVEAIREIRTMTTTAPTGTIMLVTRSFGGLHLITDPCPDCGCKFVVRKLPENAVKVRWDLTTVADYNRERSSRDGKLKLITEEKEPAQEESMDDWAMDKDRAISGVIDTILRKIQERPPSRDRGQSLARFENMLEKYPNEEVKIRLKILFDKGVNPEEDLTFLLLVRNHLDPEQKKLPYFLKHGSIPVSMLLR